MKELGWDRYEEPAEEQGPQLAEGCDGCSQCGEYGCEHCEQCFAGCSCKCPRTCRLPDEALCEDCGLPLAGHARSDYQGSRREPWLCEV